MDQSEPSARPLLNPNHQGRSNNVIQLNFLAQVSTSTTSIEQSERSQGNRRSSKESFHPVISSFKHPGRCITSSWNASTRALTRVWSSSWTAETCSYIFSLLTLAGLIITLLAHQSKPIPQWPQLVTINSVVSLFSLLMRAGVGIVLTEGTSQKL
jgi:hypothetical protein